MRARIATASVARATQVALPAASVTAETSAAPRDATCGGGRLIALQPAFFTDPALVEPLAAAGWAMPWRGLPDRASAVPQRAAVGVWGRRWAARPGQALARAARLPVLSVEDGWLRSILPARQRATPPASLLLDDVGIAIDPSRPSRLERLIQAGVGEDSGLRIRARAGIARLQALGLSKYSPLPQVGAAGARLPAEPYVVVVDQVAGDASVVLSGAGQRDFDAMLATARAAHPGQPLVIKAHPDPRRGHFSRVALRPRECRITEPINPWDLLAGASALYTVSSQLGYEAVLAGVACHVFGRPFYAGWGLTDDRHAIPRRTARPDRLALFAAAHLVYPLYWDPHARRMTDFETALDILADRARTERADPRAQGAVYLGVAPWKRRTLAQFGPAYDRLPRYRRSAGAALALARAEGRCLWAWASRAPDDLLDAAQRDGVPVGLIEDGFLRSVGLGARLTDPAALVFDRRGIHYDPARPSDLEAMVAQAAHFAEDDPRLRRAAHLRERIVGAGVTKYNLAGAALPPLPRGRRIVLVPGQVADDASVRLGCAGAPAADDAGLLAAARAGEPDAFILYKPHPDVEAGLRAGGVAPGLLAELADGSAAGVPAGVLLDRVDAVWTLTSTLGFEALLRGIPVTCLGVPFYAGWGVTRDLGPVPARRAGVRASIDALVWAALIAYPTYVHPISGLGCSPERIVEHLARGVPAPAGGAGRRSLSAAQDLAARLGLVWWR